MKVNTLINRLAEKIVNLPQPIHIIAVCSGGRFVGKQIARFLKNKNVKVSYFEVWTNITNSKATVWKSSFKKKDYTGTALIVEDVIWTGKSINAVKKMLKTMEKKKFYIAALLDLNNKADFSIFRV
jgi:hypoxanthine phosphoribosyltransferase